MALNGLFCADVPLRNYPVTHAFNMLWHRCCCSKKTCFTAITSNRSSSS